MEDFMPDVEINGFRMHYEEVGVGDPVILHHGFMGRSDNWAPVRERLDPGRRYISLDCRGAGASEAPSAGYTVRQFALDTIALADHLDLESFSFVGWSLGGGVGWQLGLNHAARLDTLILVASAPADPKALLGAIERGDVDASLLEVIGGVTAAALAKDYNRLRNVARHLYLRDPDAETFDRLVEGLGQALRPTLDYSTTSHRMPRSMARRSPRTSRHRQPCWPAPTTLWPPTNIAEYQRLPNATLHVFSEQATCSRTNWRRRRRSSIDDVLTNGVRVPKPIPDELKAVSN